MSSNWLNRVKPGHHDATRKRVRRPKTFPARLELLEERLVLAVINWDGDGGDLSWNNPLNWSTDTLPGTGDVAQIDIPGSNTISHASGTTTIGGLVSHAAIDVTGGSFTIGGVVSQIFSPFTVKGGSLTILANKLDGPGTLTVETGQSLQLVSATLSAPLTLKGTLTAQGGSALSGSAGSFATAVGSKIRVEAINTLGFTGASLAVANGFTNLGTIELTDDVANGQATLTVTSGTLVNVGIIDAQLGTGGARFLDGNLDNQGTLNHLATALTMRNVTDAGTVATNSGTISVAGGDLLMLGVSSFTNTGVIDIGSGRTFSIFSVGGGGVFNQQAGSIAGAGTLFLSHLTANFTTSFSNAVTNLALETSTLNGPGTLTVAAGRTLPLINSTISAPLILEGTLTAIGGCALSGSAGSFTTAVGSKIRVEAINTLGFTGASLAVANGFTNLGTIELTDDVGVGNGQTTLTVTSGTLVNSPGGLIDIQRGTGGSRFLDGSLDNQGTFNVGTALIMGPAGNQPAAVVTNSGAINIAGGDLRLGLGTGDSTGVFTNTGVIDIGSGRTFSIVSGISAGIVRGVFNQQAGTLEGAGTLFISIVTANFATDFSNNLAGLTLISSTFNGPGALTVKPEQTLLLVNSIVSAPLMLGGVLTVFDDCALPGGAGSLTTAVGSKLRLEGGNIPPGLGVPRGFNAASLRVANGFTNLGAIELTDNAASGASLTITAGTLVNAPGGIIDAQLGAGGSRTLTGQLDNQGSLLVHAPLQTTIPDITDNAAMIVLDGPTAALLNANGNALRTLTNNLAGAHFAIRNGATLVTQVPLTNAGDITIGPASTLTLGGDFTQTPTGSFTVEIGGSPPSAQFGRLLAPDHLLNLGGNFNITLVNGFGPLQGEGYNVLQGAGHTGDFATLTGLNIGHVQVFTETTLAANVIVTAIADAGDLTVDPNAIQIPPNGTTGDVVTLTYTVRNTSTTPVTGDWIDSLYLSADSRIDATDPLIGRVEHHDGLDGLSSYTTTVMFPLPGTVEGDYRVIVVTDSRGLAPDRARNNNVAISAGVIRTTLPRLTLGQTTALSLDGGEQRFFRVDVPPGGEAALNIHFSQRGVAGASNVLVRFGQIPASGLFDAFASSADALEQSLLLDTAGSYYVVVQSSDTAGHLQGIELTPQPLAFALQRINPAQGSNVGQVTVKIVGTGFSPDVGIGLQDSLGGARAASSILFKDPNTLFATFDLTGLTTGDYNVVVTRGQAATNAVSFKVTDGAPGHVSYRVSSPPQIRPGTIAKVNVDYVNDGETDVPAPLVRLTAQGAQLGTTNHIPLTGGGSSGGGGGAGVVFPTIPPPPSSLTQREGPPELQFLAIDESGLAGVLAPGARGHVELEFRGPDSPSPPVLTFTAFVADASMPVDWISNKADLRPPTISPEAWDVLFDKFLARVGSTHGSYEQALDAAASYLSQIGQATSDVAELSGFLISQENNIYPGATLAASIDALDHAPGLPLALARVYSQPITQRYQLGAFGRGWMHNYEMTLVHDDRDDKLFIVHGPAGDRTFKKEVSPPDKPSVFTGLSGDPGQFEFFGLHGGRLTEPDGTIYTFDNQTGMLSRIQDSNNNRITLNYANGQLTSLSHSDGDSFTLTYNAQGRISQLTDQTGQVTSYTYDVSGEHLLKVSGPQGTVDYTYDSGHGAPSEHALTSVTNRDGSHVFYTYDNAGRLAHRERDGGADGVTLAYGPQSTVTSSDAAGTTTMLFDPLSQPSQFRDALGQVTVLSYDANSHLARERLPDNLAVNFRFDSHGFLTQLIDPAGHEFDQLYQPTFQLASGGVFVRANFRLTRFEELQGNQSVTRTLFRYDSTGNLTSIEYPDGPSPQFVHDVTGKLVEARNRRGQVIEYTHNARGQLTRKTHADGSHEDYTYDDRGNVLTATDESGKTRFEYDAGNRLTLVTYPNGRFLHYTRNAGGRVTRIEAQDGFAVGYTFDDAGRLKSVQDAKGAAQVTYHYDDAGHVDRQDHANSTFTTYEHDAVGRVLHLVNHAPDGSVNSRFDYTYDDLGRPILMTTLDGAWTYEYDAVGQLTHAVFASTNAGIPSQDLQYEYDAAGNRIRTVQNGVTTPYTANNLDQYTLVGQASYSYDADGNLTAVVNGSTTTTYTFDDEGRLLGVSTPTDTWTYEYDALGHRAATVHNGQRTEFLLDPMGLVNVVGEYAGNGSVQAHYAYGLGLASRVAADGTADFYDFDALGSTAGLSGSTGSYVNSYSYLPFGEALAAPHETVANPFAFVGRLGVTQEGNGLDFMHARYYAPADGRFVSQDPIGIAGGYNLYRYATNNPVNQSDSRGLAPITPWQREVFDAMVQQIRDDYAKQLANNLKNLKDPAAELLKQDAASLESGAAEATESTALEAVDTTAEIALEDTVEITLELGADTGLEAGASLGLGTAAAVGAAFAAGFGVGTAIVHFNPIVGHFWGDLACDLLDCDEPDPVSGSNTNQAVSRDPNEMSGPGGFGAAGFLAPGFDLPYTIHFENVASAGAAAATVVVRQQLDADLDFSTFELGNFGFGSFEFTLPPGLQSFSGRLDTRDQLGIFVDVNADFNAITGLATWTFMSVDPDTFDLPIDAAVGFLPPNKTPPQGDGFVSYTVRAKANSPTGTRLDAQGRVFFDTNAPLPTNVFTNTLDIGPPTSSVSPLPAVSHTNDFTVSWTGSDDAGGSGIGGFDIYVSDNSSPFALWKHEPGDTLFDTFNGIVGHTYSFYSVATDNVGHVESTPSASQATTTVSAVRPTVVDRLLFYNHSKFDGNNAAAGASDDAAIAPDKTALLPGGTATFANYSSFTKGINGIMVDIAGLEGVPTAADLTFKVGNTNDPSTWTDAPAPSSITVRAGAGTNGSDRVTLIWPDGAIQKEWLQITVMANAVTGLATPDVFYFGNAPGESGNTPGDALVSAIDEIEARTDAHNFLNPAPITNRHDYARDRFVNAADQIVARNNGTMLVNALRLIHVPAAAAAPVADAYSLLGAASGSRPSTTPYSRTSTEAPVIDSASLTLQSRATAAIFGRLGGEPETSVIGTDEASVDDGLLELIASVDDLL